MRRQRVVDRLQHLGDAQLGRALQCFGEVLPEAAQNLAPQAVAGADLVQLVLHVCGEVIADVTREILQQEDRHQPALVLGDQAVLVLADIFAVLDRGDDAGIGRRASDAQLLHPLDQRGLGIARRGLGEMLARCGLGLVADQEARPGLQPRGGRDRVAALLAGLGQFVVEGVGDQTRGLALGDRGQAGAVLSVVVVATLVIDAQEAVEQHHLAGGAQADLVVGAGDLDRGPLHPGGLHLAGDGPLPDQVVQLALIVRGDLQLVRRQHHVGRPDALMRLLRVLGLVLVHARRFRQVLVAELGLDRVAGGHHGLGGHVDAVGPHVGDQPGLVQALRRRHAGLGAHAHLAAGLLLQGRGHEGRPGVAAGGLGGDRRDLQVAACHRAQRHRGLIGGGQVEPVQLLAGQRHQRGVVFVAARGRQAGMDGPVLARLEGLDLHLAVDDQAQADGLDAARRLCARQLAPQDRRQLEPHQIIQRAARQIGVDQRLVDLARLGHRLGHGGLGDGVEGHAADRAALLQGRGQRLQQVPADRLALAVGVGGQNQRLVVLQRVLDRLEVLAAVGRDLPFHVEIMVGVDAAVLGRQVADMAEAGQNPIVGTQVFLDGLGLGRGFDDDDGHDDLGQLQWGGKMGAGRGSVNGG